MHFKTGSYVLLRPTFVALDADDFSPDDADLVAKLEEGMAPWQCKPSAKLVSMERAKEIEVVEVVDCQGGESVPSLDLGAGPPMVHLLCDSAVVAPVLNRGGAGSATSTDGLPS